MDWQGTILFMPGNTVMTEEGHIQLNIHGVLFSGSPKSTFKRVHQHSQSWPSVQDQGCTKPNQTVWQTKAVYFG